MTAIRCNWCPGKSYKSSKSQHEILRLEVILQYIYNIVIDLIIDEWERKFNIERQ